MFKFYLLIFILFELIGQSSIAAENNIGYIKNAEGEAAVMIGNETVNAKPGTPVRLGNILKTGEHGSLGVTFKDNTLMSIGHNTEVVVDEYLYAPAHDDLKLVATLTKGTLHYISGIIAKLKPEAVTLVTPTGTIGVRGTNFVVKAGEE